MCYTPVAAMTDARKKQFVLLGGETEQSASARELIVALARAIAIDVTDEIDGADLVVLQTSCAQEVRHTLRGVQAPALVIAPVRLKAGHLQSMREAGACAVIDAEASILDVVFGISDLLFDSIRAQSRYHQRAGGLRVRVSRGDKGVVHDAIMLGIASRGGSIQTELQVPEGQDVELAVDLAGRAATIRGRVAYCCDSGFGVEFSLGRGDVAPRLFALCESDRAA